MQQLSSLQKNVLAGLLAIQLGVATNGKAQSPINVQGPGLRNVINVDNDNINVSNNNNINPINVNVYRSTGPNGLGYKEPNVVIAPKPINVVQTVVANPLQPVKVPTVVRAPIPKKTNPAPKANKPKAVVSNYKPKPVLPQTSRVVARPQPAIRRVAPVLASVVKPKPVAAKKPAVVKPAPVQSNPVANVAPTPVIPVIREEKVEVPAAVSNLPADLSVNTVIASTPLQLSTPNAPMARIEKTSVSRESTGSSSSKKTAHASFKLKRKTIKHFRYATHKKMVKLFAKTRKNKIDPVRCFVWN